MELLALGNRAFLAGPVSPNAAADDQIANAPSSLGLGVLSTTRELRRRVIKQPPEFENLFGVPSSDAQLVDDRSDLSRMVGLSADARYGFGVGGATGAMSLISTYKKSVRRLEIVAYKHVQNKRWYYYDPEVRIEARNIPIDEFLTAYGDSFVSGVITGGLLVIVYSLQFSSFEETSDFNLNVSGEYGNSSGSVSFSEKIAASASRAAISIQSVSLGVKNAPPVLMQTGGSDRKSPKLSLDDPAAKTLFEYFDNFEEHVLEEDSAIPVVLEQSPITNAMYSPSNIAKLSMWRSAIAHAADVDAEIEERLAKLEYLRSSHEWLLDYDQSVANPIEYKLRDISAVIARRVREIAIDLSPDLTLPSIENLPQIPQTWQLKKPKIEKIKSKDCTPNTVWRREFQIQSHYDNQPFAVVLNWNINKLWNNRDNHGAFGVNIKKRNGKERELFRFPIELQGKDSASRYIALAKDDNMLVPYVDVGAGASIGISLFSGF